MQSIIFILFILGIGILIYMYYSRKLPLVYLKNSATEEIESIKIGFNFVLFFFGVYFFGILFFFRKLQNWGIFCLIFDLIALFIIGTAKNDQITNLLNLFVFCLSLYIGFKGNELTVKGLLKNGYEFVDPESDNVKLAKRKWGIS